MTGLKPVIAKLADGHTLSRTESADAFRLIMSGDADSAEMAAFVMALRVRGESVDEITGAAEVMREKALNIAAPDGVVDTCGTGGDGLGTYNISTAAAIVAAAAGVPVAKHGNKAVSSKSGSADVLTALGLNLDITKEAVARSIRECGIGFLMAPRHHNAMRHVAPVRQALGVRTIFNLLGPLSNPANAKFQLIGVFHPRWQAPMAEVLKALGSERVWVVHGSDGLDEITTTGPTAIVELRNGSIDRFTITPEEAGLPTANAAELRGGTPQYNADALKGLLEGKKSAYRDIVLFNASAVLLIAGTVTDLKEGVIMAAESIDSGKARATFTNWVKLSNERAHV